MNILGIDPGLRNTGFAIIDAYKEKKDKNKTVEFAGNYMDLIEAGIITSSCDKNLQERLYKIYNSVSKLIHKCSVTHLVIEELYSHYNHPTTAILMGHARGVVFLAARRFDMNVTSLAATKVKKSITGKGNASKRQVSLMVNNIFDKYEIPESVDVTDALALVLSYMNIRDGAYLKK